MDGRATGRGRYRGAIKARALIGSLSVILALLGACGAAFGSRWCDGEGNRLFVGSSLSCPRQPVRRLASGRNAATADAGKCSRGRPAGIAGWQAHRVRMAAKPFVCCLSVPGFRVADANGSHAHPLTFWTGCGGDGPVAWYRDGRQVIFMRGDCDVLSELMAVPLAGGLPRLIHRFPKGARGARDVAWEPAGIAYTDFYGTLWTMTLQGNTVRRVALGVGPFAWSRDGRLAYVSQDAGVATIAIVEAAPVSEYICTKSSASLGRLRVTSSRSRHAPAQRCRSTSTRSEQMGST